MNFEKELLKNRENVSSQEKFKEVSAKETEVHDFELEEDEIEARESDLAKITALEKAAGIVLKETKEKVNIEIGKEKAEHAKKEVESLRGEVIGQMQSRDYLDKMVKGCDGDYDQAKTLVEERIKNVESVKIEAKSEEELREDFIAKEVLKIKESNPEKISLLRKTIEEYEMLGFYDEREHKIKIAYDKSGYKQTAIHEYSHASTKLKDDSVPFMARATFALAFRKGLDGLDGYFGNPEEMLARKKELDYDLEKLGIKKYGEKTTDEHVDKILEAYKKNLLSTGSMQLLDRIKRGNIKEILDDIAKHEGNDTQKVV